MSHLHVAGRSEHFHLSVKSYSGFNVPCRRFSRRYIYCFFYEFPILIPGIAYCVFLIWERMFIKDPTAIDLILINASPLMMMGTKLRIQSPLKYDSLMRDTSAPLSARCSREATDASLLWCRFTYRNIRDILEILTTVTSASGADVSANLFYSFIHAIFFLGCLFRSVLPCLSLGPQSPSRWLQPCSSHPTCRSGQ